MTMNSVLAPAIAAIAASVATYLLVRPGSGGGQAPDVSVFTDLLREIDDKVRDGRIDQATADAERQRILQVIVSVNAASASPASFSLIRELAQRPSAMVAAAVAVVALFVFVASENEASSLATGSQQTPASATLASSSKDPAVSRLQAYARGIQGGAPAAASAPAPAPAPVVADAQKSAAASTPAPAPAPLMAGAQKSVDAVPGSPPMSRRPLAPVMPSDRGRMRQPLADVNTMIRRLAERLEKQPDNPEGWRMLGWSYFATKNYPEAVEAYARAVALKPDSAAFKAAHAEALVKAANDVVTPEAAAEFDAVLAAEPGNVRAVYFKGLAKEQSGDRKAAVEYWTAALKAAPADVKWASEVKGRIEKLNRELGAAASGKEPGKADESAKAPEEAPKQAEASSQAETSKTAPKAEDTAKQAEAPKTAPKAEDTAKQAEAPKTAPKAEASAKQAEAPKAAPKAEGSAKQAEAPKAAPKVEDSAKQAEAPKAAPAAAEQPAAGAASQPAAGK
jgi:cytochrome c-type biogenesis protein CcmH